MTSWSGPTGKHLTELLFINNLNWIMCRVWLLGVKIDSNDCEIFVENWFAIFCLSVQRFPYYVMHLSLH